MWPDSFDDTTLMFTQPSIQYVDSGVFGGALYLDGLSRSLSSDRYLGEEFSILFRFYFSPDGSKGDSAWVSPFRVLLNGDEVFSYSLDHAVVCGHTVTNTLHGAAGGQWNEYGIFVSNGILQVYCNGQYIGSCDYSADVETFKLDFPAGSRAFGYLDELRIYTENILPDIAVDMYNNYVPTAVPVDSDLILVLPDTEDLKVPTLAVQTSEIISGYRIGGVRPSQPKKGLVWAQVENQVITSLQVYNGSAWTDCSGRVWTGSRWIPLYAFNVVTLADCYDVIGTYDNSTIYSNSGFWSWWKTTWNDFRSWCDDIKLGIQENWLRLFEILEKDSCSHNWVFVESVYADYCDSNGHTPYTAYISSGDGYHHSTQSSCSVCGELLSSVVGSCHDTDQDDHCDDCGQALNACFHGHTPGSAVAESNGDGVSHRLIVSCSVCHTEISSTTIQCADTNEDHKCDVCGQTLPTADPCASGHTPSSSTVADNNKSTHSVIVSCSVCGAEISRQSVSCVNDGTNHCATCGQALTACADGHSTTHTYTYSAAADLQHQVVERCSVCNAQLSTYMQSCTDGNEDGLCDLCGQDLNPVVVYYPTLLESGLTKSVSVSSLGSVACYTSASDVTLFDYSSGTYSLTPSTKTPTVGCFAYSDFSTSSTVLDKIVMITARTGNGRPYTCTYSIYGVTTDPEEACDLPTGITAMNSPFAVNSLLLNEDLKGDWLYDLYQCSICGATQKDFTGKGIQSGSMNWFQQSWLDFVNWIKGREEAPGDVDVDFDLNQNITNNDNDTYIDLDIYDSDFEDGKFSIFDLLKTAINAGGKVVNFVWTIGIKSAVRGLDSDLDSAKQLFTGKDLDIQGDDPFGVYEYQDSAEEDPAEETGDSSDSTSEETPAAQQSIPDPEVSIWDF